MYNYDELDNNSDLDILDDYNPQPKVQASPQKVSKQPAIVNSKPTTNSYNNYDYNYDSGSEDEPPVQVQAKPLSQPKYEKQQSSDNYDEYNEDFDEETEKQEKQQENRKKLVILNNQQQKKVVVPKPPRSNSQQQQREKNISVQATAKKAKKNNVAKMEVPKNELKYTNEIAPLTQEVDYEKASLADLQRQNKEIRVYFNKLNEELNAKVEQSAPLLLLNQQKNQEGKHKKRTESAKNRTADAEMINNEKIIKRLEVEFEAQNKKYERIMGKDYLGNLKIEIKETQENLKQLMRTNKELQNESQKQGNRLNDVETNHGWTIEQTKQQHNLIQERGQLAEQNSRYKKKLEQFESEENYLQEELEKIEPKLQETIEIAKEYEIDITENTEKEKLLKDYKIFQEAVHKLGTELVRLVEIHQKRKENIMNDLQELKRKQVYHKDQINSSEQQTIMLDDKLNKLKNQSDMSKLRPVQKIGLFNQVQQSQRENSILSMPSDLQRIQKTEAPIMNLNNSYEKQNNSEKKLKNSHLQSQDPVPINKVNPFSKLKPSQKEDRVWKNAEKEEKQVGPTVEEQIDNVQEQIEIVPEQKEKNTEHQKENININPETSSKPFMKPKFFSVKKTSEQPPSEQIHNEPPVHQNIGSVLKQDQNKNNQIVPKPEAQSFQEQKQETNLANQENSNQKQDQGSYSFNIAPNRPTRLRGRANNTDSQQQGTNLSYMDTKTDQNNSINQQKEPEYDPLAKFSEDNSKPFSLRNNQNNTSIQSIPQEKEEEAYVPNVGSNRVPRKRGDNSTQAMDSLNKKDPLTQQPQQLDIFNQKPQQNDSFAQKSNQNDSVGQKPVQNEQKQPGTLNQKQDQSGLKQPDLNLNQPQETSDSQPKMIRFNKFNNVAQEQPQVQPEQQPEQKKNQEPEGYQFSTNKPRAARRNQKNKLGFDDDQPPVQTKIDIFGTKEEPQPIKEIPEVGSKPQQVQQNQPKQDNLEDSDAGLDFLKKNNKKNNFDDDGIDIFADKKKSEPTNITSLAQKRKMKQDNGKQNLIAAEQQDFFDGFN